MKTFKSVKKGSYLKISCTNDAVHDFIAQVTYVETYGNELYISYRNTQFNHTVLVSKEACSIYVYIHKRKWDNYDYHYGYHKSLFGGKSTRKYKQIEKYKYKYKIEIY